MTVSSTDQEAPMHSTWTRRGVVAALLATAGCATLPGTESRMPDDPSTSMRVPLVLVHGVPESVGVWDPMVDRLASRGHRDIVRLSPPGFGAPLTRGFGATVTEYREWLIEELTRLGTPVDLVGHDWGGGHVVGVAMTRPDLLHSWASDVIGLFEPDYVWHAAAQTWQTPGQGEADLRDRFAGTVDERATRMNEAGMIGPAGRKVAAVQGPEMARAIIALYRSAAQPVMAELGRNLPSAAKRPGLAIIPTEDTYVGSLASRYRGAQRAGAQVERLDGLGHWWMLQDPERGAGAISAFLQRVRQTASSPK